ncbi:MAG: hypothetical protein K8S54_06320 [Spirochaetia bacterium]|nr:hypothetical protein [Spirochaetia bacterium]
MDGVARRAGSVLTGHVAQALTPFLLSATRGGSIPLNHVCSVFKEIPVFEFRSFSADGDSPPEARSTLIYCLWIFRGVPEVQALMNHPEFPYPLLEELILYAQGRFLLRDSGREAFLQSSLPFLMPQKSMELILEADWIKQDVLLVMHLMVNFDLRTVDDFLGKFNSAEAAVEYLVSFFDQLRDYDLRYFFTRNPDLFIYITSLFEAFAEDPPIRAFLDKYAAVIENLRSVKHLAELCQKVFPKLRGTMDSQQLRAIRCASLIQEISKFTEISAAIDILDQLHVFADCSEKAIVTVFLTNPDYNRALATSPEYELATVARRAGVTTDAVEFF